MYKGFFLLFPYITAVLAWGCAVVVLFQAFVADSEYYRVLTGKNYGNNASSSVTQDEGYIPPISFGSQWATLNVDGWERRDIKVFFGDNDEFLRKGAGMWINSRFCGQNGKSVLSAHVTSDFYELEVTPIGTLVTMDTVYGKYVYKVVGTQVFHYKDASLLQPKDGVEQLIMYTCYPRKNGHLFKTERMALICKKIEGEEWKTYG